MKSNRKILQIVQAPPEMIAKIPDGKYYEEDCVLCSDFRKVVCLALVSELEDDGEAYTYVEPMVVDGGCIEIPSNYEIVFSDDSERDPIYD